MMFELPFGGYKTDIERLDMSYHAQFNDGLLKGFFEPT